MRRLISALLLTLAVSLLAGCANAPTGPTTQPVQPVQPSAAERQILLGAYTGVMIAVDFGALPAADGPLATKAYNDAIVVCDQWDNGTLTEAVAIADIETDLLALPALKQAHTKSMVLRKATLKPK